MSWVSVLVWGRSRWLHRLSCRSFPECSIGSFDNVSWLVHNTQEKKLKNWYIQEYTTGTTFEPNIKKKNVNEEVKMTMVDINNKVLNDLLIDTSIRVVKIAGGRCGWKPSKQNIILLKIKKVRAIQWNYFVFCSTPIFINRNCP